MHALQQDESQLLERCGRPIRKHDSHTESEGAQRGGKDNMTNVLPHSNQPAVDTRGTFYRR